jgi:hypothetical protein
VRIAAAIALAGLVHATTAGGEPAMELLEPPASIVADLSTRGTVDRVRAWPIDWNRDRYADLLVQTAFALGGNAIALEHVVYVSDGETYRPGRVLDLGGGIRSVEMDGRNIQLSLYVYRAGDSRCCPSGARRVTLSP